jgi:hypothetical protein
MLILASYESKMTLSNDWTGAAGTKYKNEKCIHPAEGISKIMAENDGTMILFAKIS